MHIRCQTPLLSLLILSVLIREHAEARQPVYARRAMIVVQEEHAAGVGLAILRSGGNAIDAAVAVGFALAVTYPYAGNIGGGGFMLIRLADGRTTFIDFRERAPATANHDMFRGAGGSAPDSVVGWRAVAVPGTVRGFELAHKRYGHKPWAELLQPAVDLAAKGFEISYAQMDSWKHYSSQLAQFAESKRIFLKNGTYYDWHETFRQPELACTLNRIARAGASDFYELQRRT
jgi:gamma-glutamyltranspeptidase / glutathione hydrolase